MKKTLCLMAGLAATNAFAQTPDYSPVDVSLRVGVNFPFENSLADRSKALVSVGADAYFSAKWIPNAETYLSVDWQFGTGRQRVNVIPILANVRWFGRKNEELESRSYVFAGLGVAFVDITKSKTVLAGRVGFGYEFNPKVFAEAQIFLTDYANGSRGSSFGISVGYRF
jgi:hypothetical protein